MGRSSLRSFKIARMRQIRHLKRRRQEEDLRITNFKKRKGVKRKLENEKKSWSGKGEGKKRKRRLQVKRRHRRKLRRKIVFARKNNGTIPCSISILPRK